MMRRAVLIELPDAEDDLEWAEGARLVFQCTARRDGRICGRLEQCAPPGAPHGLTAQEARRAGWAIDVDGNVRCPSCARLRGARRAA